MYYFFTKFVQLCIFFLFVVYMYIYFVIFKIHLAHKSEGAHLNEIDTFCALD